MATAPEAQVISPEAARAAVAKLKFDIEGQNFHPLEVFPLFRRWPRSFVRNLVYTLVFNAMFAVFFTTMELISVRVKSVDQVLSIFGNNLVISNVIGFAFWGVMHGMGPLLRKVNASSFLAVALFYAVLGTFIVTGSFFLLSQFPGYEGISRWLFTTQQFISSFAISFVVSLVLASAWRNRVNELTIQIAIADERARVTAAERATTQANLRALQAQIEPHFLFNTLANVTSLIHTRPDDAKHMLEEFIAYLRASLATTRENETTLAKEFVLMQSFLAVLKVRMRNRLQVRVQLPDELQSFALPPMLIQPLVENAIKHGVEPKIEGGEILLKAIKVGDVVAIEVTDTGMGFQNSTSNGIGLKNVRERLDKLYDGKATLTIEDNVPSGTKITIRIPA
ncbi:MAG: sensor histidine kinase [Rhodocyclaceae bacterium]|jgi:sensor histidine kinase YesM|nr:sensor histidine kinase [Rhodocyclaceae bacterium]MCA3025951.1 sensor histidine kinase [Rhodocyclaceae bacterium]MCA3031063.1 sensor histidine kinase [Rhodocyclaceae bacterium]MCA3036298.1 sensor histidine kinase [Rhodocyclaceae bacterium]MCA3045820.1 sensor histidine kinase [Rhodocyclaceae bacterium]